MYPFKNVYIPSVVLVGIVLAVPVVLVLVVPVLLVLIPEQTSIALNVSKLHVTPKGEYIYIYT